jgi:hypothetical protein
MSECVCVSTFFIFVWAALVVFIKFKIYFSLLVASRSKKSTHFYYSMLANPLALLPSPTLSLSLEIKIIKKKS